MLDDSRKVAFEDGRLTLLPDAILPSQFFESIGAQTFSSEQRLMLAVLADAINVLGNSRLSPNRRKRNSFNEASSWVFANGITSPLSFDSRVRRTQYRRRGSAKALVGVGLRGQHFAQIET